MVVLILERVPAGLRGDLSRWMIEPKAGIFLGRMTARLRDKLWEKAVDGQPGRGAACRHGTRRASRASSCAPTATLPERSSTWRGYIL